MSPPSQPRAFVARHSVSIAFGGGLVLVFMVGCSRQSGLRTRPASGVQDSVSVGYGERSRDQAGGVPSVSFEGGPNNKVANVEELIEGRFPGVFVQRTGDGGYSVSIRGTGSFLSSEQPLWVIDGVPFETKPGRGLAWLNPADVVRIDLLRNPPETAIYGVRGANGVFVITTKRKS